MANKSTTGTGTPSFQNGAIVVLDALGFKGIWRRASADEVLQKLKLLGDLPATDLTSPARPPTGDSVSSSISIHAFSDTFIIAASAGYLDPTSELEKAWGPFVSLWLGCEAAARAIQIAAGPPQPVLPYRGSISVGDYCVADRLLLGPAVQEAIEGEPLADAAAVWLCPSAYKVVQRYEALLREENPAKVRIDLGLMPVLRDYPLPLRDGRQFVTHVVNPLWGATDEDALSERILDAMYSTRIDVQIKYQNTKALLETAARRRKEPDS